MPAAGRSEPRLPLSVAVAVVAAAVVIALVAVSAVVGRGDQQVVAGPALAPPAAPATTFDIDPTTRRLRFAELSLTLPGPPFRCRPSQSPTPAYRTLVTCQATVHRDYNAAGDDWSAVVGAAVPAGSLIQPNLKQTTETVFADLRRGFFDAHLKPQVAKLTGFEPTDIGHPGSTYVVYGDVEVTSPGLPTRSDRMVVICFRLADGRHVCYFSDRPNDAPRTVRNGVQAALASIAVG